MQSPYDTYVDRAVAWALGQVGSEAYALRCLSFAEDTYERGCEIELDGQGRSATEAAAAYGAREHQGVPPRGSFVFYHCAGPIDGEQRNWGHVGLCIGDGRVVHPWNVVREDDYLAVETLGGGGWSHPTYVGWVPVERILIGMSQCGGA